MALEPVQLDTLTWGQMVLAIRTRIPANSQGKWTLHAPVDPGVTLLELFAWLLEQRLYWMDQIPDVLVYGMLHLLGEEPLAAQPAVTLLQLNVEDTSRAPGKFCVAEAGTVMRRGNANPPLLFTLAESITLLPLVEGGDQPGVIVNGVDRTKDLLHKREVILVPSGKNTASVEILLTLDENIPASAAGGTLSLFVELENPPAIAPEWLAEEGTSIAAPATLRWLYPNGPQGQTSEFPPEKIMDGTGGLRRSGIVRLPIPGDWQKEPAPGSGNPSYKVLLQIADGTYTVSPRLLRIVPNVAPARHTWSRVKRPKTSDWLPLPGNVIALAEAPGDAGLAEYPPIEDTVRLRMQEKTGSAQGQDNPWTDWTRVTDFSLSGPGDRVFVVDRLKGQIRFGDGQTGRLPVVAGKSESEIEVTYEAGGGGDGNIGAVLDWQAVKTNDHDPAAHLEAVNVVRGEGGAESETLAAALQRAAGALRERNRAVTAADHENLAQTTPGAGFRRAHAEIGYDPEFPCQKVSGVVSVFVVPYAPRESTDGVFDPELFLAAPQPDPGALAAARARLNAGRLLGSQVSVLPPAYRSTWLEVDVAASGGVSGDLRERVAFRLRKFLDPLEGWSDGSGWPFGEPLRPSTLLREAQEALGATAEVRRVLVRISGMDEPEGCVDVRIAAHELVRVEQVSVRVTAQAAASGGLR